MLLKDLYFGYLQMSFLSPQLDHGRLSMVTQLLGENTIPRANSTRCTAQDTALCALEVSVIQKNTVL